MGIEMPRRPRAWSAVGFLPFLVLAAPPPQGACPIQSIRTSVEINVGEGVSPPPGVGGGTNHFEPSIRFDKANCALVVSLKSPTAFIDLPPGQMQDVKPVIKKHSIVYGTEKQIPGVSLPSPPFGPHTNLWVKPEGTSGPSAGAVSSVSLPNNPALVNKTYFVQVLIEYEYVYRSGTGPKVHSAAAIADVLAVKLLP